METKFNFSLAEGSRLHGVVIAKTQDWPKVRSNLINPTNHISPRTIFL